MCPERQAPLEAVPVPAVERPRHGKMIRGDVAVEARVVIAWWVWL